MEWKHFARGVIFLQAPLIYRCHLSKASHISLGKKALLLSSTKEKFKWILPFHCVTHFDISDDLLQKLPHLLSNNFPTLRPLTSSLSTLFCSLFWHYYDTLDRLSCKYTSKQQGLTSFFLWDFIGYLACHYSHFKKKNHLETKKWPWAMDEKTFELAAPAPSFYVAP